MAKKIIILDAGHGGIQSGAIGITKDGKEILEKDLNLKICLLMKETLDKFYKDKMNLFLTRETDIDLSLKDRVIFQKKIKGDLFISIHHNAMPDKINAKGFEILSSGSTQSFLLASRIRERMKALRFLEDRAIKIRKDLYVLANTSCPAVLVECGFMDNAEELEELIIPENQIAIANQIALGIMDKIVEDEDGA